MDCLPLKTIIEQLDTQQRAELAGLEVLASTNPALANRVAQSREARRRMHASAVFFIEQTYLRISTKLLEFDIAAHTGRSRQELTDYLNGLMQREPAYAWGWMRARMNERLMQLLGECWTQIEAEYAAELAEYAAALNALDYYWFRKTPFHHIKAGYHTALAVACKWYGTAMELSARHGDADTPEDIDLSRELRLFASSSMTMLSRTDGYLWDSAGAEPMPAIIDGGTLCPAHKEMPVLALETRPDCGLRLGCPALRARAEASQTEMAAFAGIIGWVKQNYANALKPES